MASAAASRPSPTPQSCSGYLDPGYFAGGTPRARPELEPARRSTRGRAPLGHRRSSRRRSASTASSTRRWQRASASCRSAGASTRAGSPCCRWAAAAPLHAMRAGGGAGDRPHRRPAPARRAVGRRPAGGARRARGRRPRLPAQSTRLDLAEARRTLDQLDGRCRALMAQENVDCRRTSTRLYFADVCYTGQALLIWRCRSTSQPRTRSARSQPRSTRRARSDLRLAPKSPIRASQSASGAQRSPAPAICSDEWTPAGRSALVRRAAHPAARAAVRRRGRGLRSRCADGRRCILRTGHRRAGRHHHAARARLACQVDALGNLVLERTGN